MKKIMSILVILLVGVANIYSGEAYHSVSMRTPKEDVNPVDYELKLGYSDKLFLDGLHLLYERENDTIYRGVELKTHETKSDKLFLDGYSAKILINESVPINEQWLYRKLTTILNTDLRVSLRCDTWKSDGLFLGTKSEFKFNWWNTIAALYETSFDTDFLGTSIWQNKVILKIDNQTLKFIHHSGSGANYWQIKQEGEYKF